MADDNPYDKTCRKLARRYSLAVLFWLLRLRPEEMQFVRWLNTKGIPSPWERDPESDTVAFLRDLGAGGLPWALVLEFQAEPDPLMFGRLLVYEGSIWVAEKPDPERGDRFCLGAAVVNLRGRGNSGRCHTWEKAKLLTHVQPVEVNLQDEPASALLDLVDAEQATPALRIRALLALVPLMLHGDDSAIMRRWLTLANAETDAGVRGDLKAFTLAFAEAAGRHELWRSHLKEWNVVRSPLIDSWKAEEALKNLVAVLEARFGLLPDELKAPLQKADLDTLERWVPLAARALALDVFCKDAGL